MIEKISTKNMSREAWLAHRRNGIGGSDAAAVVGMSEYTSPYMLWCDKTGRSKETEETEALRQGRDLEEYVAFRFSEATAKKVHRSNFMYKNTLYPWAQANIDRLISGENAGLECKTTNVLNLKKFKNGEFPDRYYTQCMHYMAVTGADRWYLAVLVLGSDFKVYTIERDEDEIEALMTAEKDFWEDYVLADKEPPMQGFPKESELVNAQYPCDNGETMEVPEMAGVLTNYFELKAMADEYKKRAEAAQNEIKAVMGECSCLLANGYKVTWKSQARTSFDYKRLIEDNPDEDYSGYFNSSVSRVFRATQKKGDN